MSHETIVHDKGSYLLIIEVIDGRHEVRKEPKPDGWVPEEKAEAEDPNGLGDWAESALTKLGITQESYVKIKEKCGLPPRCNCSKRKRWLNEVGKHFGIGVKSNSNSVE